MSQMSGRNSASVNAYRVTASEPETQRDARHLRETMARASFAAFFLHS
jgi:hypothetical protein